MMALFFNTFKTIVFAVSTLLFAASSYADGSNKSDKYGPVATMPAIVKSECASCHMVYPPGLLVSKNWQRILSNLDKHYSTDASVSPQDLALIEPYFLNNASKRPERHISTTDLPRLTTTPWFERKHGKLPKGVFTHAAIKSPTNCAACHTQAEKGGFSENQIKVPGYESRKW
jgi:mono/diheme cytochrome c family protein